MMDKVVKNFVDFGEFEALTQHSELFHTKDTRLQFSKEVLLTTQLKSQSIPFLQFLFSICNTARKTLTLPKNYHPLTLTF